MPTPGFSGRASESRNLFDGIASDALSESRAVDVRVGSSTDALTPISVATRSLAASWPQWIALGLVVGAAVLADQVTKHIVAGQLALDDSVHVLGPFSIHHVQNSGIAFGLFANATALVTALTALAVGWMLVFFARSGARHPVLPASGSTGFSRHCRRSPRVLKPSACSREVQCGWTASRAPRATASPAANCWR